MRIQLNKSIRMGVVDMRGIVSNNLPLTNKNFAGKQKQSFDLLSKISQVCKFYWHKTMNEKTL